MAKIDRVIREEIADLLRGRRAAGVEDGDVAMSPDELARNRMNLRVVKSGEQLGNYKPQSCSACTEVVNDGDPLVLYDDGGEYLPTFCVHCLASVVRELADQGFAIWG